MPKGLAAHRVAIVHRFLLQMPGSLLCFVGVFYSTVMGSGAVTNVAGCRRLSIFTPYGLQHNCSVCLAFPMFRSKTLPAFSAANSLPNPLSLNTYAVNSPTVARGGVHLFCTVWTALCFFFFIFRFFQYADTRIAGLPQFAGGCPIQGFDHCSFYCYGRHFPSF